MKSVGVLLFVVMMAVVANGQEMTKPQGETPPKASDQVIKTDDVAAKTNAETTNQITKDYVFPTGRERFNRYVKNTVGPMRLLRTGAAAGVGQWQDNPEEWGQGMKGYGRRYASSFGQNAIQQSISYGLDEAFDLDSGFVKSKREGFFPRMKDALLQNITSRTKSGKRVISVPRFAGVYTGAIIPTETWYPDRYSYKDGLRHGTTTLLTGFGINLMREFVFNF